MADNRRIAKNTLVLYLRMLLLMGVSLYTSRIVLEALGVDDYGIYSVVGGVVAMFSILSTTLATPIQRFLTFELGKIEDSKNKEEKKNSEARLKDIFSTSLTLQIFLAFGIVFVIEIVGIYLLQHTMKIPSGSMDSALWVLQCSIFTLFVNLLSVPYNAVIIAHERMSAFAYVSIIQALLNLSVAFLVQLVSVERLKYYAIFIALNAIIIQIIYMIYSSRHFQEAKFKINFKKDLLKEIAAFAGWNFFGSICSALNTQGINLLMNIFFGVVVNAARGIAVQVENAVTMFANNFTTALNPQITKSYSSGNIDSMESLVFRGTKFSFFIMYMMIVPIVIETDMILSIWLKTVPPETSIFVRLALFAALINLMASPTITAIMATGKLKRYVLEVNCVSVFVFPLSWLFYRLGAQPFVAYIVLILIRLVLTLIRLRNLHILTGFPIKSYLLNVWGKVLLVAITSFILPLCFFNILPTGALSFIVVIISSILSTSFCIWFLGMNVGERVFVKNQFSKIVQRISF